MKAQIKTDKPVLKLSKSLYEFYEEKFHVKWKTKGDYKVIETDKDISEWIKKFETSEPVDRYKIGEETKDKLREAETVKDIKDYLARIHDIDL